MFWRTKRGANCLAVDLGTEYIKALVFSVDEEKIDIKSKFKVKREVKNLGANEIIKILKDLIYRAEKKSSAKISSLTIGFSGNFLKGNITAYSYCRPNPQDEIIISEIENIIQKSQWKALDILRKDFFSSADFDFLKIVDAQVLRIILDKKDVESPIGGQGENLVLEIANSATSKENYDIIKKVASDLKIESKIVSLPCAVANLIKTEGSMETDALIIDAGSSATVVSVLKNGLICFSESFPLGGEAFSKKISEIFSIPASSAEKIKIKYAGGNLSGGVNFKLRSILKEDARIWSKAIKIALEKFLKFQIFHPSAIYLLGGASQLPEVKEAVQIMAGDFKNRYVPVVALSGEIFYSKIKNSGEVQLGVDDVACFGLASLALNKHNGFIEQTLKRANRIIQEG
ncbi:MAG: cell division FtsA domain-containing protein [bacterium]